MTFFLFISSTGPNIAVNYKLSDIFAVHSTTVLYTQGEQKLFRTFYNYLINGGKNLQKSCIIVSAIVPVIFRNGFNTEKVAKIAHRMLPRHSSSCQLREDKGPSSTRYQIWRNKHSSLSQKFKENGYCQSQIKGAGRPPPPSRSGF